MLKLHDLAPGVFPHPKWLRESELKHCRIAMLASVGAFASQYGLTIPGYTANVDPVQNLNAFVLDWPLGFTQVGIYHEFPYILMSVQIEAIIQCI